jgi:HAD superfamily hydrolase (TIGR01509 family)
MPEPRPGVLFDVDGTLLDTTYLHVLAFWQAFGDTGHAPVPMERIHRAIGLPSKSVVRHLLGHDDEAVIEAHSRRLAPLREKAEPLPGTADLLRACADRGLAVVLVTSGAGSDLEWMLPALGARDAVTGATTSDDVEDGKPEPDPLGTAIRAHGLDPQRTVVVGDAVWDVEAARKADLPVIGLTSGGISAGELTEAGADAVYADPAELLDHLDGSPLGRLVEP